MADYQNKSLIKRVKRKTNFTHLSNEVFNASLSPDALGVLCYILHLPDDWVIHKTHLQKVFNVGRERMDRIFNDIEKAGFLVSMDMVRVGGKFVGRNYFFYDEPQNEPITEKPLTAKPTTANTQLLNTNIELNTNNTNSPISPKGESEVKDNIEESINSWVDAYLRIHEAHKVRCGYEDVPIDKLKRHYSKWLNIGRDPQEPLMALQNILKDNWQRTHHFPQKKLSNLFNVETVAKWRR